MVDKSTVYALVEGMYFFWTKAHQISNFWTCHCLSEVVQIPVSFKPAFLYLNFAPFCNILAKT